MDDRGPQCQTTKQTPLCYRNKANGEPEWKYTPARDQSPDYLRKKFHEILSRNSSND